MSRVKLDHHGSGPSPRIEAEGVQDIGTIDGADLWALLTAEFLFE